MSEWFIDFKTVTELIISVFVSSGSFIRINWASTSKFLFANFLLLLLRKEKKKISSLKTMRIFFLFELKNKKKKNKKKKEKRRIWEQRLCIKDLFQLISSHINFNLWLSYLLSIVVVVLLLLCMLCNNETNEKKIISKRYFVFFFIKKKLINFIIQISKERERERIQMFSKNSLSRKRKM